MITIFYKVEVKGIGKGSPSSNNKQYELPFGCMRVNYAISQCLIYPVFTADRPMGFPAESQVDDIQF